MKAAIVKSEWASLTAADDSSVIVCTKDNGEARCIYFESLEKLKHSITHKKVYVKKWAVSIPKSLCILKRVTLPTSELDEAVRMIEFELPSLVPLSLDEIVYGCSLLDDRNNAYNVLVCIIKSSSLNEYLEQYKAIGIESRIIMLDSLAIQNWFNSKNDYDSAAVINAVIDQTQCKIQTSVNGNFQKATDIACVDGEIEERIQAITPEIIRQAEELFTLQNESVTVLLTGPQDYTSRIEETFKTIEHNPNVIDSIRRVPYPKVVCQNGEQVDDRYCLESVIAVGLLELAVSSKLPHSNLVTDKWTKTQRHKALQQKNLIIASLSLVLILFLWLYLTTINWRLEKMCQAIELEIAPIEHTASTVDIKRQRVGVIRRQMSNRDLIPQIIEELYQYTPKYISISELQSAIKPDETSISIRGQADSISNAFDYTESVSNAKMLHDIQIENVQQGARIGASSVVEFKAHLTIVGDQL